MKITTSFILSVGLSLAFALTPFTAEVKTAADASITALQNSDEVHAARAKLEENPEEAIAELTTLYENGIAEAAEKLGDAYSRGQGVEKDIDLAIDWYLKCGDAGWGRGYSNAGRIYQSGKDIEQDFSLALYLFDKAVSAETPDPKAGRYAGLMYENGEGVEADEEKAFSYYELSAIQGDSTGTMYYGDYLLTGRACEQDVEQALAMYERVVEAKTHDYEKCAFKLGEIYREGQYVEQDLEKAAKYYQIAIDCIDQNPDEATIEAAKEALESLSK